MINIAICDDDYIFCSECEKMINDFAKKMSEKINIEIYYSTEKLWNDISRGDYFDLIFLDIEFNGSNGIELGIKIREELNNNNLFIVFVSGKTQYAMKLFAIRPLDFLIKPIDENAFHKTFLTFLKLSEKNKHVFEFMHEYRRRRIDIGEIVYFSSSDKEITMYTKEGVIRFFSSLKKIEEQLNGYDFLRCHHSYLVNYHKVTSFYYDRLVMENGDIIPIAQSRRSEIRKKQLQIEMGDICGN